MKLLFQQRLFSWFDSYDIYDEAGNAVYTVKGELAWGHRLRIYDAHGEECGVVAERVLRFLPCFDFYIGTECAGSLRKELSFFRPRYYMDFNGWHVEGGFLEWDYTIYDADSGVVAVISKELFHLTDTYVIDVEKPENALCALMFVLAIDAEKCSRN